MILEGQKVLHYFKLKYEYVYHEVQYVYIRILYE